MKNMKKCGFTLIELLAVIIILAIITLIAVPLIINIIGKVKDASDEESINRYINKVELDNWKVTKYLLYLNRRRCIFH